MYSLQVQIPDELIPQLRDWLLGRGWGMYPVPSQEGGEYIVTYRVDKLHNIPEPWKSMYPDTLMIPNERPARGD